MLASMVYGLDDKQRKKLKLADETELGMIKFAEKMLVRFEFTENEAHLAEIWHHPWTMVSCM